ncbi:unnamed protein product [Rotaria sordida]|uniref:MULE transposase domain-containing protein n=1 Tax=Rotaria sordida TaxID=392033 RepID=A0A815FLY1_9BILA|nr:unnamed protein product [Rotaria sordida]
MPVTTRAAALRSQANEAGTLPANETISKEGACFIVEQESPVSPVEFAIQVDSNRGHTGKKLSEEVDMSLEGLFSDQELILSAIHEDETAKQEVNKKSISPNSHNHQATSSSSTYSSTTSSVTKSSTATNEVIQKDHSIFSLASSDEDNDDIYYGDSNAIINKPVIKGDTAVGTSSRGGRMIFMNQYGVVDEFISIKTIVEEEYRKANLSAEEKRIMPLPVQIESGLNKLRRKALPPLPNDQKFIIPDVYKQTYTNERFLIYDKRKTAYGGRLLIFASEEQLKVLLQRHETYEAIFRCLNRLGSDMRIDLKPTTIICDFEQAFINAASNKLPQTFVTGCWFHFCLSCYRNIQKLGLMKVYDDDLKLRELLRGFMALALLPINRIQDGSAILKQNVLASNQTRQLEPFVSYFENEWLNTFKPSTWSVNTNTWRTNNFAEAQNKRFFSRVVQPHPNLWCFIQCLKQEESVISHRMVQTGLGFSSIKSNKSTRKAACENL